MREQKDVAANGVARHQQPTAQPLLKRMITIADTRLGRLNEECIRVFQQEITKKWITEEFFIQLPCSNAEGISTHLNNSSIWSYTTKNRWNTYHSFIPH